MTSKTENSGSGTETVKAPVEALTFEECNCEVKVLKKGTLEVHWISGSTNGTATENGAEVTVTCSTIFGNVHCVYVTEKTDLGTLTGGKPAKLDVNAAIPRLTTNVLCSSTATWEGSYQVTSPESLFVTELAGLTLTPDPIVISEKGGESGVDIRNTGTVEIKNIKVLTQGPFLRAQLCEGVTLIEDEACDEVFTCLEDNKTGSVLITSNEPFLAMPATLKC